MVFGLMPSTRANVAALKTAVRKVYPQIKSSHVDEAIAFGFGFDTHAAMLPVLHLADTSSCMTAQTIPDWFALLDAGSPVREREALSRRLERGLGTIAGPAPGR